MNLAQPHVDTVADIQAIRSLKHRYMAECDRGYPPEALGPLFTDDAVWENDGLFGRYEGRAAIEEYFGGASAVILFAAHLALNDIIEVDGDSATGQWRMLMPCTVVGPDGAPEARFILGDYHEKYVRQNGTWLFQEISFFININVAATESWAGLEAVRPPQDHLR